MRDEICAAFSLFEGLLGCEVLVIAEPTSLYTSILHRSESRSSSDTYYGRTIAGETLLSYE
jgi:hypothetical protein